MKNVLISICTACAFFVAAAVAQTSSPSDPAQGTTSSSPSMGQQTPTQDNSQSTSGSMSGNSTNSSGMKSGKEARMRGCIESQNGQYVLQTRRGREIPLTGQDVSAHNGHEVTLHGMWTGNGSMSDTSASSSGATASARMFNVSSVDMISETCSLGKSSTSGSGMSGSNNNGSNSGSSSGTTTTTPPQ